MFDATGFSWTKILWISVAQVFLSSFIIIVLHKGLAIEVGTLLSIVITLSACGAGTLSILYTLKKKHEKHTEIVKSILNFMTDVVIVKNYQGDFIFCNNTVAKIYNTTPEEMVGKNDYFFTKNREQSDFFIENVQAIMNRFEKEEVYESTTDVNTGETKHFQSTKIPFYDAQGRLKILIIAKDITDIAQLKEEAERNKLRLEHVLDVSEEGLWEWNTQTNQVLHNKRWELITGLKRSDNSLKEFESCILQEDREKVFQALNMLMEHNQPYNIEFRMQRPNGEIIWVWDRGRVAEFDDEGTPLCLVGIIQDITAEKSNQEKVEYLAYYDQLTSFINRTQLEVELKNILEQSKQKQRFSAVLFLDLDRFKILNDSYGHHIGDKLLQGVVERINKVNQGQEIVSRIGGDEFIIILPLLDSEESAALQMARQHARSMIKEISSKAFTLENDIQNVKVKYSITASIGGIVFKSNETSPDRVLQLADTALQRIKVSGGNAAIIYDLKMQDELKNASELQKTIHHAIASREFCIYLQPKYDLSEQIVGAEALIRWHHPKFGVLFPGAFIDMAEENNMILPIGDLVLKQTCEQLKKWQTSPATEHLELSMNLSAKQIWQSNFVDHFISIVDPYGIDHTKLTVEITESVFIQDINDAVEKLVKLKQYGVSISLDDFGTGYSSLNYLRSLPIDEIKIDRSFINDIAKDSQARIMVKSIIELAKNFEMSVISEGVEDLEQLELLKLLGVPAFQGFYFSKPLSIGEIDKLLADLFPMNR